MAPARRRRSLAASERRYDLSVPLAAEDVVPLCLAEVTFPAGHPLAGQDGEVFAFLVRHPRTPVLFETGSGRGNAELDDYYRVRHHSLEEALAAAGIGLSEVRAVVNSHLHFDHAGNNRLFPGVPIYVQSAEQDAARQPGYTVPEWVDFPDAEYAVIDGESRVASGVRVMPTKGHTAGHQSLVVETNGGTIVLAGQAIYSKAEFEFIRRTGGAPTEDPLPDPQAYLNSALSLIDMRPRRIYFSHDRAFWAIEEVGVVGEPGG